MQATRLIAVRHGETDWNVQSRLQGQTDVPLNEQGRRQAACLPAALAHDLPDVIYSSDLARALDTARAVADSLGLPVLTDQGLRERHFGLFEGYTYTEVEERWPDDSARWRRREPNFGPDGGETLQGFYDRSVDALTRIAARHPDSTVMVVAHGGVLDCFYRAASKIALDAPRTWAMPNTGINRLLYTGDAFTLIGWADTGHLGDMARDETNDRATRQMARPA